MRYKQALIQNPEGLKVAPMSSAPLQQFKTETIGATSK
jgi:hypothetical protein